jgi:hypothetical protein
MDVSYPAIRQIGYVVEDVDEAILHWVERIGVVPFVVYRQFQLAECFYEGQPTELELSVAYAQAGEVQIELIQQHGETPSPYLGAISTSAHHFALWTTDYDRDVAAYRERGFVDLQWGSASGAPDERFVYFAPSGPGPMIEVVEVYEKKREMYRRIADAARSYDGTNPVREAALSVN